MKNIADFLVRVDDIYKEAVREAASLTPLLGGFSPDKPFSFSDYPVTRQRVKKLLESLARDVEVTITDGIRAEWTLANGKNDALARGILGKKLTGKQMEGDEYRRYFSNNEKVRDAFIAREENGLNLSDRVWRYTDQFKTEIEMGLDLGLRDGLSADGMSRTLRQYLKYPDMLFRRVRDEHGQLHLSRRAAAFHPGRGVYRSSYKNARRLAATETNMAYRTSDYTRHQQLDFVVGIEVHLSGNHTLNGKPFEDICDDLKGKYPKDFKFTGWHPLCRCYTTTILKTPEEIDEDDRRIMAGEEPLPAEESKNFVKDVPKKFNDWIENNADRIESAKSLPYFIKDNRARVDAILNPGQKPLTTLEKAKIRHDARTPEQADAIRNEWNDRKATRIENIDNALNKEYKGGVVGKDITSSVDVRDMVSEDPYRGTFTNNIARMQGFDAPAKLVSEKEFEALAKENGDVLYRTVMPANFKGKDMTSEEFASQLYKADKLEMNGRGARMYGDGIYVVSSAWDGTKIQPLTESVISNAYQGSARYGKDKDYTTLEMTWTRKPKLINQEELETKWMNLSPQEKMHFGSLFNGFDTYGCALGYDGMYVADKNYITVWNRSIIAIKNK